MRDNDKGCGKNVKNASCVEGNGLGCGNLGDKKYDLINEKSIKSMECKAKVVQSQKNDGKNIKTKTKQKERITIMDVPKKI